jgi:hypothetical protein
LSIPQPFAKPGRCEVCGAEVLIRFGVRPRKYCTDRCRAKAYRSREPERAAIRLAKLAERLQTLCHESSPIVTKGIYSSGEVVSSEPYDTGGAIDEQA